MEKENREATGLPKMAIKMVVWVCVNLKVTFSYLCHRLVSREGIVVLGVCVCLCLYLPSCDCMLQCCISLSSEDNVLYPVYPVLSSYICDGVLARG